MKEQEIVVETIISLNEYLPKFINGVNDLVDFLRKDKLEEAHEILLALPEGLGWIYDVIRLTSNDLKFEAYSELIEISNSINESIENGDYNLLADILEYELIENCNCIKNKVENFLI